MGRPVAVVEDEPGTTRDILYGNFTWGDREIILVDTGGLEAVPSGDLTARVRDQAEGAIQQADLVLFLVDAREGITAADAEVADMLRKSRVPVILVPNKADNETRAVTSAEFYQLGIEPIIPISAIHDVGIGELMAEILERIPAEEEEPVEAGGPAAVKLAIIGRPNVGKSSLLNAIVGFERAIVHDMPGTTRDALDTMIEFEGKPVLVIDTAGMRRRGHIARGVESHSVLRAIRALSRCDVAVVVIDASEGLTAQDLHIAGFAKEAGKGIVIAVNKMDLVDADRALVQQIQASLDFIAFAPVHYISARTGQGVKGLVQAALQVAEERTKRLATRDLNDAIERAVMRNPPPHRGGRSLRVSYVTQARAETPTFVFFVNDPALIHFSYARYLENQLRARFGFKGTPIKLIFRGREERPQEAEDRRQETGRKKRKEAKR